MGDEEEVMREMHEAYLSTLQEMAMSMMTDWDSYYSIHKTPPPPMPRVTATTTPRTTVHPLRWGEYATEIPRNIWPEWVRMAIDDGLETYNMPRGRLDGWGLAPSQIFAGWY